MQCQSKRYRKHVVLYHERPDGLKGSPVAGVFKLTSWCGQVSNGYDNGICEDSSALMGTVGRVDQCSMFYGF